MARTCGKYPGQSNTLRPAEYCDCEDNVLLRIWNDGPSLPEEVTETLFEKYRTGENGEFGLGLAIVKRIADNHNARVWARNEENGVAFYGVVFYVEIKN